MATTESIHRSLASLSLPKPVPALITYAQGIVKAMTANASFPSPTPTLASISEAITELQTTETAALARTKGAASTRNDKRTALVTLLQQLRGYIQTTADANVEAGASIIQSAGIAVKKSPVRAPRVFGASPGPVSGSAKLVAASAGHRASYEWQFTEERCRPSGRCSCATIFPRRSRRPPPCREPLLRPGPHSRVLRVRDPFLPHVLRARPPLLRAVNDWGSGKA